MKLNRKERRSLWISYALSKSFGADPRQIIKEAGEKFDRENPENVENIVAKV